MRYLNRSRAKEIFSGLKVFKLKFFDALYLSQSILGILIKDVLSKKWRGATLSEKIFLNF